MTKIIFSLDFHTLGHIIQFELSRVEQQLLLEHIIAAVRDIGPMDAVQITMLLRGANPINGLILQEGIKFVLTHSQRYIESAQHNKSK